jgi:hypothetical protein
VTVAGFFGRGIQNPKGAAIIDLSNSHCPKVQHLATEPAGPVLILLGMNPNLVLLGLAAIGAAFGLVWAFYYMS